MPRFIPVPVRQSILTRSQKGQPVSIIAQAPGLCPRTVRHLLQRLAFPGLRAPWAQTTSAVAARHTAGLHPWSRKRWLYGPNIPRGAPVCCACSSVNGTRGRPSPRNGRCNVGSAGPVESPRHPVGGRKRKPASVPRLPMSAGKWMRPIKWRCARGSKCRGYA